jgi:serine protease Do
MTRMLVQGFLNAVVVLTGCATAAQAQSDFLRSNPKFVEAFHDIARPHALATVRVQCDGKDTCLGIGVGADGWILTKADDLRGKIACMLPDGRRCAAKIVGVHEANDLAMLQIDARLSSVVEFADSSTLRAGAWVVSPGAGKEPPAIGIVSVATRKMNEAFLGVQVESTLRGLIVHGIVVESTAWKAGVHSNDILLSINGHTVDDADHLQQIMADVRPNDPITVRVRRARRELELKAIVQSREPARSSHSELQNRLGTELSNRRSAYGVILQHDSVLQPSDCGGPLIDLKGRVVGINISRAGRVETWAIPGEVVRPLLGELKSGRLAPAVPR